MLTQLREHGLILLVVNQPATTCALPVAIAQVSGSLVGYLPGLAMRRIEDLHPGEGKTDARDAAIIAERMPPSSIQVADEQIVELSMHCGFDDDFARQIVQSTTGSPTVSTTWHNCQLHAISP